MKTWNFSHSEKMELKPQITVATLDFAQSKFQSDQLFSCRDTAWNAHQIHEITFRVNAIFDDAM